MLTAALAFAANHGAHADDSKLTVFAAASLTNILNELAPLFERRTNFDVSIVVAGTGALARQIENGAPAHIFMSANEKWMVYLSENGVIDPASQRAVATNRLALIAPAATTWSIKIDDPEIDGVLEGKPFALADPESVPAGMYGAQSLRSLGLYEPLAATFVLAPHVRVVLTWVARGDAAAGLVYDTDALIGSAIRVVTLMPEESHDPITYWAAHVSANEDNGASEFLDFLVSPKARAVFASHGFGLPESASLDPPL